jgi:16S rRNA (cytidine1402-2'-O)-methyltransferase
MMPKEQSQGTGAQSGPSSGTLFLVGVPIGHPDDLTIRALATLRRVDLIAAKNPQLTQSLLSYHGICATITTYDREQCGRQSSPIILDRLKTESSVLRWCRIAECRPCLRSGAITHRGRGEGWHMTVDGDSRTFHSRQRQPRSAGMDGNAFVFEGRCDRRHAHTSRVGSTSLQHESEATLDDLLAAGARRLPLMLSHTPAATLGNRTSRGGHST